MEHANSVQNVLLYQPPSCLTETRCEVPARGLVIVSCRYWPESLDPESYSRADIAFPPSLMSASAGRRAEYLAGRWCARKGLQFLGISNDAPSLSRHHAPCWPDGAAGSISHRHGVSEVIVADTRYWLAVGIDTEVWLDSNRARQILDHLLTNAEREQLIGRNEKQLAVHATLAFSAKEALFKALYPLVKKRFYFHDAEWCEPSHIVLLKDLSSDWLAGTKVPIHYRVRRQSILTWLALQNRHNY